MKKTIFLLYLVSVSVLLVGQNCGPIQQISISSQTIGNMGAYFDGTNVSISSTIGNIVTETFSNENGTLTQGFQQSIALYPDIEIIPISCFGASDGYADISIIGGIPPYTFQWWNSDTSNFQNNLSNGEYYITIFDADGNSTVQSISMIEPQEIDVVLTGTDVGTVIGIMGSIDISVSGGSGTYFYNWSNSLTTDNLINLSSGLYTITITDANGCTAVDSIFIDDLSVPTTPNWQYSVTSANHTILILGTIDITINSIQIEGGDYVGVFYDSSGTLKCGGYSEYQNIGNSTISAWENDGTTSGKDGFYANEQFVWKIWDASENTEFIAEATYMQVGFSHFGNFATNGLSGLANLTANVYDSQFITFPESWSIFSTYIIPSNPNIDDVMQNIISDVIIVKNDIGQTYWPQYSVNLIGDLYIGEGYQINMNISNTLEIVGSAVVPENTTIILDQGWSIIAYLRNNPAAIVTMLDSISNSIIIVKNGLGNVYWPQYGVNLINTMYPGEGYQINLTNSVPLTYPAN
ncbi:MAG: hypothetical protein HN704_12590 [Bacteroidetes bacterium]|nr:hypothetical protein [Bacteroidota bacterium]MBT6687376.1 hypothetical protein [Bacteroidota bacterium]MBT7143927.1 hypothetical protein [Bacteroidota bacterium]MBT7492431.1 hypothetical protein [Bacteroidota bacterium]